MFKQKMMAAANAVKGSVKKNFVSGTIEFLFIVTFVNVFQWVFGAENTIVGVVFTILMGASMARDYTAAPLKHFLIQALVLVVMTVAASFAATLPPAWGLAVNCGMIFIILYSFTYEYASHLYFPYLLSYLFLIFLSPIPPIMLPKRLLGVLTGTGCIILYQLVKGRKRVCKTAREALCEMAEGVVGCIDELLEGTMPAPRAQDMRNSLYRLSRVVYERRKRVLRISDASFAMVDVGRGLENLNLLLIQIALPLTLRGRELAETIRARLLLQINFLRGRLRIYARYRTFQKI